MHAAKAAHWRHTAPRRTCGARAAYSGALAAYTYTVAHSSTDGQERASVAAGGKSRATGRAAHAALARRWRQSTCGTVGPWTGTYHTAMEGGLRVPLIVRWPGRVAAGRVSDDIVHVTDLYSTLIAAGGVPTGAYIANHTT